MASRFGEDKVAEIRERASIAEIISRYVALKRSGRGALGLCPFHAEKTPSFSVVDERGFFHCFGCGESGDVFKFLMRIENLTFPEALERLARELGIELPKRPADTRRDDGKERLLELNARAGEYFQRCLWNDRTGGAAREYLERRGITDETARRFGLGYAPGEGLVRALETARVPFPQAEALGLIGRSRSGGWYDRFRDRLMFPITDRGGKVIAFGGRILAEGQPKYLNSPESVVFRKRQTLYGLAAARDTIRARDRVVVVEGYIDVIALSQAGITDVVAPLGTALTADQIRLLRRFTDRIVVLFDGDPAGAAAAARSFPVFAEVGLFADGAFLPAGHDPDTFVRESGPEALERLIADAIPLVDHYVRTLSPPDGALAARMRAGQTVAELIARTGNPIFSGLLARRAAELLGLREEQLLRGAEKSPAGGRAAPPPPPSTGETPPPVVEPTIPPREEQLIALLAVHPSLREALPPASEELFTSDPARALFRRVVDAGDDVAAIIAELPRTIRDRFVRAFAGGSGGLEDPLQALRDCLTRLEQDRLEGQIRVLREEVRHAEARGDQPTVERLVGEIDRLARRGRS